MPAAAPTASTKPAIRSRPPIGSSRNPKVSARWNINSESVEPAMLPNSSGSTANSSSRRIRAKSAM